MQDTKDIATKITRFRTDRNWRQSDLAKYLKTHQSAVSMMENGKYVWTPLTVARYSRMMPEVFKSDSVECADTDAA